MLLKFCFTPFFLFFFPSVSILTIVALNLTTGGPYTYSQGSHHFYGTAFDGTYIDTKSCCCGSAGSCRDNPSCQCQKNVGPLPQGTYTLGNMFTYKGYPYSYNLYPASSNNMCGRSEFLIHGGNCNSGKYFVWIVLRVVTWLCQCENVCLVNNLFTTFFCVYTGNPSIGCIVIPDENTRYRIKSGATLKVIA